MYIVTFRNTKKGGVENVCTIENDSNESLNKIVQYINARWAGRAKVSRYSFSESCTNLFLEGGSPYDLVIISEIRDIEEVDPFEW